MFDIKQHFLKVDPKKVFMDTSLINTSYHHLCHAFMDSMRFSDPPSFIPKTDNPDSERDKINDQKQQKIQPLEQFEGKPVDIEKYTSKSGTKSNDTKYSSIEEDYEFQDYSLSYNPIPRTKYDFLFAVKNDKQEEKIDSEGKFYRPVIAFRGVFKDRIFFFYGTSLFVVSMYGDISPASLTIMPYCYCPYYHFVKFRDPIGWREKKIVKEMLKYFSKDSIYQKKPVLYSHWADVGLPCYGIESAHYYPDCFIPMGDVIPQTYD